MSILHNQIIIQLIGFVAFGLSLLIYQFNKRRTILNVQLLASLLFSVHFFLLGAYAGSAMNFLGATRNYFFNQFRYVQNSVWLLWLFVGIFAIATALTWQNIYSVLPAIGTISGAFAAWQSKTKNIRLISLISPPAWLIYAVHSHSYAGIVTEVFVLSSILLGMYRFDWRKKAEKARSGNV